MPVELFVDGFTPARIGLTRKKTSRIILRSFQSSGFTDLRRVRASSEIALSHRFFDAIDFALVTFTIFHCTFLRLFQRLFERLHSIHRRFQTFLQLRQFTSQIGVLPNQLQRKVVRLFHSTDTSSYLFVHFGQLVEIVFQERNLLFLRRTSAEIIVFDFRLFLRLNERTIFAPLRDVDRTFFNRVCKSWTNNFRRLCNVCNSLATVSSRPMRSCFACSRRSCCNLQEHVESSFFPLGTIKDIRHFLQSTRFLRFFFLQFLVISGEFVIRQLEFL